MEVRLLTTSTFRNATSEPKMTCKTTARANKATPSSVIFLSAPIMLSIICMYLFYVWGFSFAGFTSRGRENLGATCDMQTGIATTLDRELSYTIHFSYLNTPIFICIVAAIAKSNLKGQNSIRLHIEAQLGEQS